MKDGGGGVAPTHMARSTSRSSGGELETRVLSLEEVLRSYDQPLNEEQAWAVCYQCCRGGERYRYRYRAKGPESILLHRDGTVTLRPDTRTCTAEGEAVSAPPFQESQLVQSMGVAIYQALDWGLADSEERDLSPHLEQLIERMVAQQDHESAECLSSTTKDEGYSGPEDEDEEEEEEEAGRVHAVRTVRHVMTLCARRLANPAVAPEHYQAVCRALFLETLELQTFLCRIRDAKEMLRRIRTEESQEERCAAELDNLKHTDWARLWVQLMRELRQGVKLKKVEQQPFDPLPTEFSLTPFEMLMEDIRSRRYTLRKVMVDGDIPSRVKQNAHELILDFIRSRPPLKPVSERSLPPRPQEQQCLHDRVLAEIRQEHKLRPVEGRSSKRPFGSLPCLAHSCHCDLKSTSCIDLSITEGGHRLLPRPRVLLKAPTLAEMEEMNLFEDEDSPDGGECVESLMKRDRSFSEHDLAELLQSETDKTSACVCVLGERPRSYTHTGTTHTRPHRASLPVIGWSPASSACRSLSEVEEISEASAPSKSLSANQWMEEFSHPVESLALTLDEVISVRRVLVKAEMEKFLQRKELYNNLRKGKVCCCCRVKFPLFSWPSTCLLCKRSVCGSCSAKMKMPSKKLAHIPVYAVGFHSSPRSHSQRSDVYKSLRSLSRRAVEDEFPYLYVAGCSLRDVCAECTKFVADVVSSSRRSLDIINNTPKREKPRPHPASHYMPPRGGVN
ncbi:LOW QUALITY PROTEIN: protein spire homolog 2 [Tachysurus vachellii]|uniref:LOW QUALITY PROTEIN: protein spire homolog 2 n=1 Tax=Tachysurus vachellii TaxID=175792 RepID=UPI00296A9F96|nr:LOW QUALITY PROTEIN: protein spire homolog 2 [Tachysurus vachellii]